MADYFERYAMHADTSYQDAVQYSYNELWHMSRSSARLDRS